MRIHRLFSHLYCLKSPNMSVLVLYLHRESNTSGKNFAHAHGCSRRQQSCCPIAVTQHCIAVPHTTHPPQQVMMHRWCCRPMYLYPRSQNVAMYDPFTSPLCWSSRPRSPCARPLHLPRSISVPPDRLVRDGSAAPTAPTPERSGHLDLLWG